MSSQISLIRVMCPKCKTDNGAIKLNPGLILTLFIEVACSNCRQRVITANDTPINQHNAAAMEIKQAQDEMRKLRGEYADVVKELEAARERISDLEIVVENR